MARVHHFGLRDRPNVHSKDVQYDERPLLGFEEKDLKEIETIIFQSLVLH